VRGGAMKGFEDQEYLSAKWVFPKNGGTPKWMVYNGKPY